MGSSSNRILAIAAALCLGGVLAVSTPALASQLTYQPVNPAFGGSPLNDNFLITTAQIENQHTNSGNGGGSGSAPVINFPPITIDLGGIGGDNGANGGTRSQQTP